jgi:hypothetical protein
MALDPQTVRLRLRKAARRLSLLRSARWFVTGTACSILNLFLFLIGDVFFHFGAAGRWAGFFLVISPLVGGAVLAMPPLFKRISEEGMARRIERSSKGSRNVLINAVQFNRELAADSPMRAALFQEMWDPFPGVRWSEVFDLLLLKKILISFAVTASVLSLWGLVRPAYFSNSMARVFLPASQIAPLTRTRILELQPKDTGVPNGGGVTLSTKLGGEIPRAVRVHFREKGGSWQKELLEHELGTADFTHAWKEVRQSFEYYLEAGDAESQIFTVNVRPKTVIITKSLEITPPAYTGLPNVVGSRFTTVQNVVPGSKLHFTTEFNNPLKELLAKGDRGTTFGVSRKNPTVWEISGVITSTESIKLSYVDKDGIADSETIPVETKPDLPPKIEISNPAEGSLVLAKRENSIPVQCTVSDDYGIGSLALYQSTSEKPDAKLVKEWKDAGGKKVFHAETKVPLSEYSKTDDQDVTFCLIAKDRNDVTGPGVTVSRPVVIQLKPVESLDKKAAEVQSQAKQGIEELLKLQETNLNETRATVTSRSDPAKAFPPLTTRQATISELAEKVLGSRESITPELRSNLKDLLAKEMKDVVIDLRNAASEKGDQATLTGTRAVTLEAAILARLKGTSASVEEKAKQDAIAGLVGGVESLLRKQKDLSSDTLRAKKPDFKGLADRQDALGDESQHVTKEMEQGASNPTVGDEEFRGRLKDSAALMKTLHVYADMLGASEKISEGKIPETTRIQGGIIRNLESIMAALNKWRVADAEKKADEIKKEAAELKDRLELLAAIQKEILEKSKELSRKTDFKPEDYSVMKEIAKSKELMAAAIEQMLKDGHIFPDVKQGNEMQVELTKIFEDVIQADKKDVEAGNIKPVEIAVQKEEGILKAIEQAKKIDQDMEMWLMNTLDNQKWLLENFDKTEMPDMPMLKLPEQTEDLIGDLLEEQKGLADQVENSAANQLFAENAANGNQVQDGNQDCFGSQGKSGNQRPKNNEQAGRSSGGREGMSDGEMAGKVADNLEGSKAKVRRTRDAMQNGQIEDNGPMGVNLATGGGKSGGYSQQGGMDGDAPVKAVKAKSMAAANAAAAKQALLAEKTSRQAARASLLFLKTDALSDVPQLMEESTLALKEGQLKKFSSLHGQIVAKLQTAQGEIGSSGTVIMKGGASAAVDKQTLGGDEGEAPQAYRKQVADYYRSLSAPAASAPR